MDFQYEPLDLSKPSIRLLRVLPRRDDGRIICEIVAVELPVTYAALSYHWGSPGDENIVTLLSPETGQSGVISVRQNLFDFLSRASVTEEYRRQRWWIDALCIDQLRIDERNQQVQQMGIIYAGAKRVHIWLGLDPLIARVFTFAHKYWKKSTSRSRHSDTFLTKVLHDHLCLEGISRLRVHPYWSRLWIVQEVLLSEDLLIVAGHLSIPWEYLSVLEETIQQTDATVDSPTAIPNVPSPLSPPTTSSNLKFLLNSRPRHHGHLPGSSSHDLDLLELLEISATSVCQDIRDKVYGILALIHHHLRLPVNYHISVNALFYEACSFYACWTKPDVGLGLVRRLADALEIDLHAMSIASPSSMVHTFTIEPVELERRFGRGVVRTICTQCEADIAWAESALAQSDPITRVWCIQMGTRPWLHVFFDHGGPHQSLNALAIASQHPDRGKHEERPHSVIPWPSDTLEATNRDGGNQLGHSSSQHEWPNEACALDCFMDDTR